MPISDPVWRTEIGRGSSDDETTWDAIDTTRAGEALDAIGSRQRGSEQSYAAVAPLKSGKWLFYRSTPSTNGRAWLVSTSDVACRNAARKFGEGTRLGIGDTPEERARVR